MASILADSNSYSMKVAVFHRTDKTDLTKRNEYGYKCMLVAVKQVFDYMEALNETMVDVGDSLRKESRLFDFLCFRRAWLNACLYNRWSRQTLPAVYMFEERIEVILVVCRMGLHWKNFMREKVSLSIWDFNRLWFSWTI